MGEWEGGEWEGSEWEEVKEGGKYGNRIRGKEGG